MERCLLILDSLNTAILFEPTLVMIQQCPLLFKMPHSESTFVLSTCLLLNSLNVDSTLCWLISCLLMFLFELPKLCSLPGQNAANGPKLTLHCDLTFQSPQCLKPTGDLRCVAVVMFMYHHDCDVLIPDYSMKQAAIFTAIK